jgi:hypothetical protein
MVLANSRHFPLAEVIASRNAVLDEQFRGAWNPRKKPNMPELAAMFS